MKLKKIKNYIFAFVLSIISLFIISNDNISADNFIFSDGSASSFSYNEGVSYPNYNGNSNSYLSITRNSANEYLTFIVESRTYTYVFNKCEISSTSTSEIIFNCALQNGINKNNTSWETLDGFNFAINKTTNFFVIYNQYRNWSYQVPTSTGGYTEEDLEEAYNQGYTEGTIIGFNNGLMIESCSFSNVVVGSCDSQYYTLINGSIDFDSLNDYVYNLGTGGSYSITFTFTDNISADALLYARFKETEGASISFYNDNTLLETLYNSDFDSNQSDYYKTFRLSDFGQISTAFNKIVINNINYDYSISEFGVLQNQSYNLGEENGEILGYYSGFANGNIVGFDRGYIVGRETGNNLVNLVGAIFTGPVIMLQSIFNFEILGVNIVGFLFSILTLLVVIWLIKRFI